MSRTRRSFSAKFKSELVIELLKGEKDLNTIATENNIQPNLLHNWKGSKSSHKYFALSSLLCMIMAIYTGHKMISGNKKAKSNKEKVIETEE